MPKDKLDKIQKTLDLILAELKKIPRERNGDGQHFTDEELYEKAKKLVIESGRVSGMLLMKGLKIGYAQSARLIESLKEHGVVKK
jgi:DNA segregation ATPase FtsK/SpoIIIE-like protein